MVGTREIEARGAAAKVVEHDLGDQAIAGGVGMAIDLEEQPLALARCGLERRREIEVRRPVLLEPRGERRPRLDLSRSYAPRSRRA